MTNDQNEIGEGKNNDNRIATFGGIPIFNATPEKKEAKCTSNHSDSQYVADYLCGKCGYGASNDPNKLK